MSNISFGVHIGRTSMCLAAEKDGRIDVIANDAGDFVTPAMFGLLEKEALVGLSAKQLSGRKPNSVASDSKGRISEKNFDDFELEDDGNQVKVGLEKVHSKFYSYMKEIASSYASDEVSNCNTVITVPLDFGLKQREFVRKCAISAGFNVSQVISETSASILAYNLIQDDVSGAQNVLIYRCGGKSLTVSVVLITNGMLNVLNSVQKELGGDQITDILIEMLAQEFKRKHKVDPRETKRGKMKLKLNSENVKKILSTLDNANCYIESLYEGIDFNANISRSRFENEFGRSLQNYLDPINEVLNLVQLKHSDINKVILCGGTSKIPKLQNGIKGLFTPQVQMLNSLNPDEVISTGAASQASLLQCNEENGELNGSVQLQSTNYDLVFTTDSDEKMTILIPRQSPIPLRRSHHFPAGNQTISVKLFLRSINQEVKEVAKLGIEDLVKDGKASLSAHIHRDGAIHIALTDKVSNKCDQVTIGK